MDCVFCLCVCHHCDIFSDHKQNKFFTKGSLSKFSWHTDMNKMRSSHLVQHKLMKVCIPKLTQSYAFYRILNVAARLYSISIFNRKIQTHYLLEQNRNCCAFFVKYLARVFFFSTEYFKDTSQFKHQAVVILQIALRMCFLLCVRLAKCASV